MLEVLARDVYRNEVYAIVATAIVHDLRVNATFLPGFPEIVFLDDDGGVKIALRLNGLTTSARRLDTDRIIRQVLAWRDGRPLHREFVADVQRSIAELEALYKKAENQKSG